MAIVDGYATAIFEVARAEDALAQVEDELYRLARIVEGSDELRQTLSDASIPPDRRQAIIEELLAGKAWPLTISLASFLVGAGRGRQLPEIVDRFVERAAAERQHVVAEVRSAIPLDEDQQRRLAEALSHSLRKKVEVKVIVDPEVLGGLVARVDDTVIDGTVRHRLEQLRAAL